MAHIGRQRKKIERKKLSKAWPYATFNLATFKAPGPLKSLLDIIRPDPIQHETCDCLFQRHEMHIPDDIITLRRIIIKFVT